MSFIPTKGLSSKIDLTENGDFGPKVVAINSIQSPDENELMSPNEYARIERRESIFGKKIHRNVKDSLFDRESKFMDTVAIHCEWCGKEFKIPWKYHWRLCKKCNEAFGNRIPWRPEAGEVSDIRQDTKYNLFNSR